MKNDLITIKGKGSLSLTEEMVLVLSEVKNTLVLSQKMGISTIKRIKDIISVRRKGHYHCQRKRLIITVR